MRMFFKKTWGYGPHDWPLLGFSTKGGLNRLEREYHPGDWVVIAGTQSYPTDEADQGRLLAMVRITNTVVDIEPILKELGTAITGESYNDRGEFRWPQGFPYLEGRSFIGKPLIKEVLPNRRTDQGQAEAAYALPLDQDEVSEILKLKTTPDDIREVPQLKQQMRLAKLISGSRPGPVPGLGERTASYEDGENSVYIFRISGTNFYKVGRSNNIERRLQEFNSSPHAIWAQKPLELVGSHPLPDAASAHEVEQLVHKKLEKFSRGNECFEAPEKAVVTVLPNAIFEYSKS